MPSKHSSSPARCYLEQSQAVPIQTLRHCWFERPNLYNSLFPVCLLTYITDNSLLAVQNNPAIFLTCASRMKPFFGLLLSRETFTAMRPMCADSGTTRWRRAVPRGLGFVNRQPGAMAEKPCLRQPQERPPDGGESIHTHVLRAPFGPCVQGGRMNKRADLGPARTLRTNLAGRCYLMTAALAWRQLASESSRLYSFLTTS